MGIALPPSMPISRVASGEYHNSGMRTASYKQLLMEGLLIY